MKLGFPGRQNRRKRAYPARLSPNPYFITFMQIQGLKLHFPNETNTLAKMSGEYAKNRKVFCISLLKPGIFGRM